MLVSTDESTQLQDPEEHHHHPHHHENLKSHIVILYGKETVHRVHLLESLHINSALKMETVCFSKTLASIDESTWCQDPEEHHHQ
jgi:hypothetical protein